MTIWQARLLIGSFSLLVFVSFAACKETFESRYVTKSEAQKDGAMTRGWIPDLLPDSAKTIYEWHNIDTNRVFGRFEFSPTDEKSLRMKLDPVPPTDLEVRHRRGDPAWWPELLTGKITEERLQGSGVDLYRFREFYLAVDWRQSKAYFWANVR